MSDDDRTTYVDPPPLNPITCPCCDGVGELLIEDARGFVMCCGCAHCNRRGVVAGGDV